MPPLWVDPALLGGATRPVSSPLPLAKSGEAQADGTGKPVALVSQIDRPVASVFPHPATTPFSATDKKTAPTNVWARQIDGLNDVEMVAEGDAVLERAGDTLSADRIVYRQLDDEVEAIGNVRLTSPDTTISGPRLRMRLEESTGKFDTPDYTIRRQRPPVNEPALTLSGLPAINESGMVLVTTGRKLAQPPVTGSGSADRLEFRGKDQYYFENASYSTCEAGKRDWEVHVDELDLDYLDERGLGRHASVRFMGVPLFYSPWLSFSLNNQRKSGFLPPTIGTTNKSGIDLALPYYWNIAPHMDATLTPRVMSKRGMQLNAEFRYLINTATNHAQPPGQPLPDQGQWRLEYLPDDQLANRDRYAYAIKHTQTLRPGLVGALNLNGVSDGEYFSDISTRISQVSQGNLLRQGILSYGGPWYSIVLNVQSFQTLQNLAKPYERLPQITLAANRYDLPVGLVFNLSGEYVHYEHDTLTTGKRVTAYPQLSLPLANAAMYLTPKIGVHATSYMLDKNVATGTPESQHRTLPILSVDSGIFLERETEWFGDALIQTLEPRAYYVYIPKRDQSQIPVFDTGRAGLNYASLFSENRYAGSDRIGNANELTLAVTSRFLDRKTGAEYLRATLGQRSYFTGEDPASSLPGETLRTSRKTNLLAALTGKVLPDIYADTAWQYSPSLKTTERFTVGGRYRPSIGRILNAGYRYVRDPATNLAAFEQIDVSGQWPLGRGWHGVGRYNYSIKEKRVIETIGGLEYNAGCWVGRFVVQRLATIADKPTTALFFQLELNDFSRIGSNPMQLLRRSIPGYGVINQPTADPVFAED
jgi:LPS-assembly protein